MYSNFLRALVGTGRACIETLRPLAYSLLAEIVHHVRGELTLSQVLSLFFKISSMRYFHNGFNFVDLDILCI